VGLRAGLDKEAITLIYFTEHRDRVASITLYSVGSGFKSAQRRVKVTNVLWFASAPPSKCHYSNLYSKLGSEHLLPQIFQSNIHLSSYNSTLYNMMDDNVI
jgi:hypothetical protein